MPIAIAIASTHHGRKGPGASHRAEQICQFRLGEPIIAGGIKFAEGLPYRLRHHLTVTTPRSWLVCQDECGQATVSLGAHHIRAVLHEHRARGWIKLLNLMMMRLVAPSSSSQAVCHSIGSAAAGRGRPSGDS